MKKPSSASTDASSARPWMPSLPYARCRWFSTVRVDTVNACAIATVSIPFAASSLTCCSRRVNTGADFGSGSHSGHVP